MLNLHKDKSAYNNLYGNITNYEKKLKAFEEIGLVYIIGH